MGRAIRLRAVEPFRLDWTLAALQRLPANPVDVQAPDGRYLRAFHAPRGLAVWEIAPAPGGVSLRVHGDAGTRYAPLARRMLGLDVDVSGFDAAARHPVLRALARRFAGLKPPRFASLWESCVNTVAFQQLSLAAGLGAVRRIVERFSPALEHDGVLLRPFPAAEAIAAAGPGALAACRLSAARAATLHRLAEQVAGGALREEELEALPVAEAERRLREVPGVGPWTAQLLLLRGLRRLEVFPAGDAGAARRLAEHFPEAEPAVLLAGLGPWRGMLYYHLLLAARFGAAPAGAPASRRPSPGA